MNEVYFPDDVFNIIKQYADIDPIKHRQKKLKELFKKKVDTYFDAQQALEWGIIDQIV